MSSAASALRSILSFGVSGNASMGTTTAGTRYDGTFCFISGVPAV